MIKGLRLGVVAAAVLVTSCSTPRSAADLAEAYVPAPAYTITAYVRPSGRFELASIDARRLTHINYAFADVQDAELVLRRADDATHLRALTPLRSINPNLKILLSVGGWSWSGGFSGAARSDSSRERFAGSGVPLVQEHPHGGSDLDGAYPGMEGASNVHRPEDKQNFTRLLAASPAHLDDPAERTGRVEPSPNTIA